MTSGVINFEYLGLQTIEHVLRVCRTWDSIMSLMPKGGETIWGHKKHFESVNTYNCSGVQKGLHVEEPMKYRGIISFGKAVSELLASLLTTLDSELEVLYSSTLFFGLNMTLLSMKHRYQHQIRYGHRHKTPVLI